jgi:ParB family chromosome partitioning protein
MVAKKRGLGRGLDVLLTDVQHTDTQNLDETLQHFPLDVLQPGKYQPRVDMSQESLDELAESIKAQGLVQPIIVRPIDDSRYEIIAGERRWRASKQAGLTEIPAVVRDVSDRNAIAMALIENIQRENLNPMEEANALHRLREEFELTHQEAAQAVGRSRASVSNLLRLRNLNEDVKRLVENCDIEMGHARALLALESSQQSEVAHTIIEKSLSVREAEQLIRRIQKPASNATIESDQDDEVIANIEKMIDEKLGKGFAIKHTKKGKGKLVIDYKDIDDLKKILKRFTK